MGTGEPEKNGKGDHKKSLIEKAEKFVPGIERLKSFTDDDAESISSEKVDLGCFRTEVHTVLDDLKFKQPGYEEWGQAKRDTWTGKLDFILSCVAYAVGLGNVWRFPYLCYRSGGGAFLVPYVCFLILCGMPLITLEMAFGQFASLSPTAIFANFCPLFQGLGWGQILISAIVCVYYNIIITWTLYYLYLSFRATLPWITCGNTWNTGNCVASMSELANGTGGNGTLLDGVNETRRTASEEFWQHYVLRISSGIDDLGEIQWQLLICLFLAWLLVFLCLFKGVKTSGRAVYVVATFPYLVLIILLIRGVTLPGAAQGIKFYLIPQWHRLKDIKVWLDAASQIFYSVGAAWGAIITMASYNKFHHNCYRDALIIPVINCATSVFAGIVVFSIIGFMAHESGQSVDKVIASGPGLAFVVYPEAVAKLPISPFWSILFFAMILNVGIGSQFAMFENVISACVDTFPNVLRKRKIMFTGIFCMVMFLFGLPCITQAGIYILTLMDWYSATFSLMIISMCECLLIGWWYDWRRFFEDIWLMVHRHPSLWFRCCWQVVTPVVILLILILSMVFHVPATYNDYDFPDYAIRIGWVLSSVSLLPIPIFAIYHLCTKRGTFLQRLHASMIPTREWGPSRLMDRVTYQKSLRQHPAKQMVVAGVDDSIENDESEMMAFGSGGGAYPVEKPDSNAGAVIYGPLINGCAVNIDESIEKMENAPLVVQEQRHGSRTNLEESRKSSGNESSEAKANC